MDLFFFSLFAFIALICAVNVVLQKHPISSALSQVIVYAGAVMVLFVFVIMLLNAGIEVHHGRSWMAKLLGFPAFLAILGLLCFFVQRGFPNVGSVRFGDWEGGGAQQVGYALFTEYLLPFEVTSVLILIAIIGAIVLARKELD